MLLLSLLLLSLMLQPLWMLFIVIVIVIVTVVVITVLMNKAPYTLCSVLGCYEMSYHMNIIGTSRQTLASGHADTLQVEIIQYTVCLTNTEIVDWKSKEMFEDNRLMECSKMRS